MIKENQWERKGIVSPFEYCLEDILYNMFF